MRLVSEREGESLMSERKGHPWGSVAHIQAEPLLALDMSESKGPRSKYKTMNWASYNASLKAHGSLTVWLDTGMHWYAPATGKRGRQPVFSDAIIQFCLSIKSLFSLALRQSQVMVESSLRLAGLDFWVPDFSTVWRRPST